MKKSLLSFFLIFLIFASVRGQNLELYQDGSLLPDTLTITEYNAAFGEMTFHAVVKNNFNRDVNLYLGREILSEVEGSSNYFCWANGCWPTDMDTSSNFQTIAAGEMSGAEDFSAHYNPYDHYGTTVIKYTFFDADFPDARVSIVVRYQYENSEESLIQLINDGEVIGDTVVVTEYNATFGEMSFHAVVKNNSDRDANLYLARENLTTVDGSSNYFCWANGCWPPDMDTSANYQTIAAGDQSGEEDFSTHYNPMNHHGTTVVKYTFFDADEESLKTSVVVKYVWEADGINDHENELFELSDIFPNPATDHFTLNYDLSNIHSKTSLKLFNLLGSEVKNIALDRSSRQLVIQTGDLAKGIYFYSIVSGNKVLKTKKLIIQ